MSAASEFISKVKEGAYADRTNALRAVGVWSRYGKWSGEAEVNKVKKYIDGHFGNSPSAAKPAKKAAKKAVARKGAAPKPTGAAPSKAARGKKAAKKKKKATGKKAARKASAQAARGTLEMNPSDVKSVADILRVIDSTVERGVRTVEAMRQANELSPVGDITKGVEQVKAALVGAASILNNQVVAPLSSSYVPTPEDAANAERLREVVGATDAMNASMAAAGISNGVDAPPPPAPPPAPAPTQNQVATPPPPLPAA